MDIAKNIFLEDEIKDGFYISSMVKRSRWQSLLLLYELDRVCKKYGLHYYLDWGTLLGAVRHGGFIPWDDDVDVCMHRNDVEKLKELAPKEFPKGYMFLDFENSDNWNFIESLVNTEKINFDKDYLQEHDGYPYIVSIDIFVLDNVTEDKAFEEKRAKDIKQLLTASDLIDTRKMEEKELKAVRQYIFQKTGFYMQEGLSEVEMKRQLFREAKRIMMLKDNEETDYVVQMVPWGLEFIRYTHRSVYENAVRIPFEGMELPVPACYDKMLSIKYGRYEQVFYGGGAHEYPYFEGQAKQFGEEFVYPVRYRFQKDSLMRTACDESNSLKKTAKEVVQYLLDALEKLNVLQGQERQELLEQCQAVAIDFGTLVEQIKGEGTRTVSCLEQYCEVLYQMSIGGTTLNSLKAVTEKIIEATEADILNRREILFIPYKPEHWDAMRDMWQEKCKETNTDVYVVAVPYYYKDYDGRLRDMVYEPEKYPAELKVTGYEDYALPVHCPDEIYIQNPYDEYNMAVSVHPNFYASKLRSYTNQLVYMPYFETTDFEQTNWPQVYNMRYYCTVPGVVLADKVLLTSKVIRERYIEALTEFAGSDTKEIWEERIAVIEPKAAEKTEEKKKIVFSCSLGTLLEHKQDYLAHLEYALETFRKASKKINVIWYVEPWMERKLEEFDAELYADWQKIRQTYENEGWGALDDSTNPFVLAQKADAYYGDTTVCLKEFEMCGKPIMLSNPTVGL